MSVKKNVYLRCPTCRGRLTPAPRKSGVYLRSCRACNVRFSVVLLPKTGGTTKATFKVSERGTCRPLL